MNFSISVVVTTYNQAPYIAATLDSVFAQTHKPFEVIVVNDGSTDDTENRITPYQNRIRYAYQHNQGVADARNTGIHMAKGELLAFLDGDDLWDSEKLAKQILAAEKFPDAGMIVADGVQFSEHEKIISTLISPLITKLFTDASPQCALKCYDDMLLGNPIATTSQVMIPAKVFDRIGVSDERFPLANDYDLYLRIAQDYRIVFVREPLVRWRYLATSASGPALLRNLRGSADIIAVQQAHLAIAALPQKRPLEKSIDSAITRAAIEAYYYGRSYDRRWATRYLARLLLKSPLSFIVVVCMAGLWSPRWLNRSLGSAARRTAQAKTSATRP